MQKGSSYRALQRRHLPMPGLHIQHTLGVVALEISHHPVGLHGFACVALRLGPTLLMVCPSLQHVVGEGALMGRQERRHRQNMSSLPFKQMPRQMATSEEIQTLVNSLRLLRSDQPALEMQLRMAKPTELDLASARRPKPSADTNHQAGKAGQVNQTSARCAGHWAWR